MLGMKGQIGVEISGRNSMNSIIIHATLKEDSEEHYAMVSEILRHFNCGSLKVLSKKALDSA